MQGRSHNNKVPRSIPNRKKEYGSVSGDVDEWIMTPEEVKEYFATKYPDLEKWREIRKSKVW